MVPGRKCHIKLRHRSCVTQCDSTPHPGLATCCHNECSYLCLMQCSFKITTETSYNFLAAVGVRSITHSAHSAHGGHIAAHFISLITNTSVATVQSAGAALSPAAWSRPLSVVSYYIIYLPTLRCDLYPDPDQYLYDPRIVSRLRVTTAAVSSRRKHEIFLLSPNIFLTRAMFRPPLRGGAAGPRGG